MRNSLARVTGIEPEELGCEDGVERRGLSHWRTRTQRWWFSPTGCGKPRKSWVCSQRFPSERPSEESRMDTQWT